MSIDNLPTYEDMSDLLLKSHIFLEAAEAHGVLCGLLVCNPNISPREWLSQMGLEDSLWSSLDLETQKQWMVIHAATLLSLRDPEYRFEPLLPNEEEVVAERTHAVGLWCKGFVAGVEHFGNYLGGLLGKAQEQVEEAMKDLQAIADVDHKVDPSEEQKKALSTIVEYIRIAVLLIQRELSESFAKKEKEGKTLH